MSKSIREIQKEVSDWAFRQLGPMDANTVLLGVVEEVGELAHARLKMSQGIRVGEDHEAKSKDAVGDIVLFLMHFCDECGYDLQSIIDETWDHVSKRNWRKNKETGEVNG